MGDRTAVLGPGTLDRDVPGARHERERFPIVSPPLDIAPSIQERRLPDLDRFVTYYRKAGGQVELELLEGEADGFLNRNPTSPASRRAIDTIIEFVHKQLG